MNFIKVFLLLLSLNLFALNQLENTYYIENDAIFLSDVVVGSKSDQELFKIDKTKHSKRVKTKKLLQLLNSLGYKTYTSKHNYTHFIQKSPISLEKIELFVKEKYQNIYKNIVIENIILTPRTYRETLPLKYEIFLKNRALLSRKGTLYIKTIDNKKIFFNYSIDAKVNVVTARDTIKKDDEISHINSKKKSIILKKFKAMPLVDIQESKYQAKHKIKKGTILTQRDVSGLYLVKRGSTATISIKDANILVSFSAKANTNARYGETISFITNNGKKIKAMVVGHNRAEMR